MVQEYLLGAQRIFPTLLSKDEVSGITNEVEGARVAQKFLTDLVTEYIKTLGSREAASIVTMLQNKGFPNIDMTRGGIETMLDNFEGINKYYREKYSAWEKYRKQTGLQGDSEMFNQQFSQRYPLPSYVNKYIADKQR
jgi:hypothetical protein